MAKTSLMKITLLAAMVAFMSVAMIGIASGQSESGQSGGEQSGEHGSGGEGSGGEGGSEGAEGSESGAGGEEGGTMLALDETFDTVRKGAHLVMGYDAEANAFTGTVTNTTDATLELVRVEIHLSSGTELGPTTPMDLAAGASMDVRLDAPKGEQFDGWVPHAEVGPMSQSGGGEGGEGSGGEGSGSEHGSGGEGSSGG